MIFLLLTIACGTNRNNSESPAAELTIVSGNVTGDIDSNALPADYELLFIGNSHSSFNGLPNLVAILIEAGEQGTTANAGLAPGWNFLSDRLNDGVTQQALEARAWTHVFLQAQKYSSTGQYSYSTEAAEEWIRRVKTKNALPIMFPEWPRRGNTEEGQRVYELHRSIALEEPACVAPVGPVWDEFILRYPAIGLHATDGNHSNLKGALLSAYVFYQIISGNPASGISYIAQIDVSEQVQEKLKEVASVFHNTHLPCA
jgi:hypothetical protein